MRLLICTQAVDRDDPILGFFHRWLEEIAKHAERVTVICLRKGDYALPGNVEVISLGTENRIQRTLEVCALSIGRRHEYDAVFVHMNPEYIVAAGWLWRLLGKRVALWYVHQSDTWFLRVAHACVSHIYTVSKNSFPFASPKIEHTGHGIDVESFIPKHVVHPGFRILTIGRTSEKKNTRIIAEAVEEFSQNHPDVTLDVYGEPVTLEEKTYAERLKEWAKDHPEIRLKGSVRNDEVPAILQSVDVFVNMGETGGVDKAILEAGACGVPTVSSGEANRIVLSEASSVLVILPKKEALIGALEALYAMSRGQRDVIGRSLRGIVERDHSLKNLIHRIIWNLSKNR